MNLKLNKQIKNKIKNKIEMFNVINILTLPWLCWGGGERGYDLGSQMHVQTINHKDASVEKKRNAKLKQSKVNENKPNDKPFFLFFQLCVLVAFFSPVQSSPVQSSLPPFNKKRLMVGLILIRQLGWEGNEWGLNFLVYYLYSNYSPTTQLFYLTSPPSPPPIPPNSQFPIGLNYCKKKEKKIFWRV